LTGQKPSDIEKVSEFNTAVQQFRLKSEGQLESSTEPSTDNLQNDFGFV